MERNEEVRRKQAELVRYTHFEKIHTSLNMDDGVVPFLMAKKILTFDRGHELLSADQAKPKEYKKSVRELISALSSAGDRAFTYFAYALLYKSESLPNREIGKALLEGAEIAGAPFNFDKVNCELERGFSDSGGRSDPESSVELRQQWSVGSGQTNSLRAMVTVRPQQEDNSAQPVPESDEPGSIAAFAVSTPRPAVYSPESEKNHSVPGADNRDHIPATGDHNCIPETGDGETKSDHVVVVGAHPTAVPSEYTGSEPVYPIRPHRCGFAWIFNVSKFTSADMRQRIGSAADCRRLQQTFPQMHGLLTHVEPDPTATCIRERLNELATSKMAGKYDIMVIAILSHCTRAQVYGSDGALVPIRDIMDQFNEENAPNLAGKPKVFIVQGCQGVANDTGEGDEELQQQLSNLRDDGTVNRISHMTPPEDMILAYSSLPGHLRWQKSRHEVSPFVNALTLEIARRKEHDDFAKIAITVADTLAEEYPTAPRCSPLNGLRKLLYF